MILIRHFYVVFAAYFFLCLNHLSAQDSAGTIERKLSQYKESAAKERLLVITDRDVYGPGEQIWLDITAFDIFEPRMSKISSEVTVSFLNQKNYEVFNKKIILKEGSASSFVQVPTGIVGGVYQLKAKTNNSGGQNYYSTKVVIHEVSIPKYVIETTFPDKDFIPGDQFAMSLQFKDFYNEPEKNVEYQIDFYDGAKKVTGTAGKTKKTGQVTVNVKVPLNLKTGFFSYRVSADCKSGQASLSGAFPILSENLFIDFYPENGKLIDGMNSEIKFHAYDVNGLPIAIEADLLENEKPIKTFTSDADGLGSFAITPDITKKYQVQMKRPLLLEQMYDLPPVDAKGVQLKLLSKTSSQAKYKLLNGYESERSIYLLGIARGRIFWSSEHALDRELELEIDLTKASGPLAHMLVFNAAEQIEGEHIMAIPDTKQLSASIGNEAFSDEKRGENKIVISPNEVQEGKMVFTAVNSPWMLNSLINMDISSIALPRDLVRQMVFTGAEFNASGLADGKLEKYLPYYVPEEFGMDKVMNKKGAYHYINKQFDAKNTVDLVNSLLGQYGEEVSDGKVTQTNMLASDIFATSNPDYIASLNQKQKENKQPAYKEMLDKNVPVMDVLQAVKPYTLEGNNIVFMSSARSISSQGGALIVIDGIATGTDPSAIRNLNPLHVESISASTEVTDIQRYTALNSVGIIEITTKSGDEGMEMKETVEQDHTFEAPDYSTKKSGPPDYRKTLNWVVTDMQAGSASDQVFYNSDLISRVEGRVYIIPTEGTPIQITFDRALQ